MCLLMTYTELVVTENESMHHNIELTHQIKFATTWKQIKQIVFNLEQNYTSGVRTYKYLRIL